MKHDHDAVLDMWADGVPSQIIGRKTGIMPEYVRTIVIRARKAGDGRAIDRPRGGLNKFSISTKAHKKFADEADRRGIGELELASLILESVCDGDLFDAVLDDGE